MNLSCTPFSPVCSVHVSYRTRGNFADAFGEDFLGLRELGIAAEFGLSSLSVPKKLLKNKGKGAAPGAASAYVSFSC